MADAELQEEKKKGGMLKWIIIAVVLLALAGGGYFAYTQFFAAPSEETAAQEEEAQVPAEQLEGQLVPLPVFLVNLADPLGRRYLKLGLEVEIKDAEAQAAMDKSMAKIKDSLLLLLSSKTYDELSTMQAKIELKQDIVDRLNQIIGNGNVLRVYITEMVIQ